MGTEVRSVTHVERALERLLTTLKRPQIEATLAAFVRQVQKIENASWEVADNANVENGEGAVLQWIGRIVGRGRGAYTDEQYRIGIRAQVRINRAIGNDADISDVSALALPEVTFVTHTYPPKSIVIEATSALSDDEAVPMADNFRQIRALGTRMGFMWSPVSREQQFICDDATAPFVTAAQGCGDATDPDVGGRLQTVDELT